MDLDSMKYAELQKLAKELGLKANVKADKLLKAIKENYEREKKGKEPCFNAVKDAAPSEDEEVKAEVVAEVSSGVAFVNTRRGKTAGTKRKLSAGAAAEAGSDQNSSPAKENPAPAASGSSKRRRVSEQTEDRSASDTKRPEQEDKAPKGGKIPRLQKKPLRPITPNFKKIHEAQFNKMESISSYVERKTKQIDSYREAVKELKMLSEETKLQIKGKPGLKPKATRPSLFSPAPPGQVEERRRQTLLSASKTKAAPRKSVGKEVAPFQPSVLSTRRINVRFTEATKDNEHKRSLLKTPARMSPCVASSTPVKTTASSAIKTPGPFVFTGNTSANTGNANTPGTQKKNVFDLKASLARPLNYKPHTGKLTPFGETKENPAANKSMTTNPAANKSMTTNPAANKSMTTNPHQNNYKQHKVQTRDDRRAKQTEDRKQKKNHLLGARRGLVMM